RRGRTMFHAKRACAIEKPIHRGAVEASGFTAQTIGLRQPRQELQIDLVREPPERPVSDLIAHFEPRTGFQVLRDQPSDLLPIVVAIERMNVQAIEKGFGWP